MNNAHRQHREMLRQVARGAMVERDLLPDFSPEARNEVDTVRATVPEPGGSVRDLRSIPWASIDNDDSRDLDQLTVAEAAPEGGVRILVAIADVDEIVRRNSAVDDHARHNTTSVYTAAQIFPMLPERLSTDLTSLGEEVVRPAIVVEMSFGDDGALRRSDIYRAVVRNRAKLAYDAVAAWLDGVEPMPDRIAAVPGLDANLHLQDRIAQTLKSLRHHRGALDLQPIQAHPVFDGDEILELEVDRKNRAKELIEDLMIAANGVTARFLEGKRFPSLRRVVRSPSRWERIVDLAAGLGTTLPWTADSRALGQFLADQKLADPLRFPDLSLTVIKLLGRGEYTLELPGETAAGHFGLAVQDYTHSTAPNRRFPDLVTQRLLKAALAGGPPSYSADDLGELARHCTRKEDDAEKVERLVRKSAAALLLESRVGERFEAIVTGASQKGTWVRTLDPPVEGMLVRGAGGVDVGDRIRVRLIGTDAERGYIDFRRVRR